MKSTKNGGGQFDVSALYSALDFERMARNLNWKEVSAEFGCERLDHDSAVAGAEARC